MTNDSLKIFCSRSLFVWNTENAGYNVAYPAENLLRYSLFPFSFLGLSGLFVINLILFFTFTFGGYFMYLLLKNSFKLSYVPSIISGLFYVTTPVIFHKVAAGHIPYIVAYALSPIIMVFFIKYTTTHDTKNLIITSLLLSFATIQIQFAVILVILFFFYAILIAKMKLKTLITTFFFIIFIVLLIHSFWLLPDLNSTSFSTTLQSASSINDLKTWGTSLTDAFRMMGYRSPHFETALSDYSYKNVWDIVSFSLVIFVFSSLLVTKSRIPLFFAAVSVVTLIFTTVTGPFAVVVYFLYSIFPIFNLFREVYHLAFLIGFSYSIMLAFFLQSICNSKRLKTYIKFLLILVIAGIVIFNDPFIYSGNFSGQVQSYQLNNQTLALINNYLNQNGDYRVLYLPMIQPFKYDNLTYYGVDPEIAFSEKPTIGNYINSNFLNTVALFSYMPSNLTNILDILSVKYIFVRNDLESMLPSYLSGGQLSVDVNNGSYDITPIWTNGNLFKNILNQQNLNLLCSAENLSVFENNDFLPHIYPATVPIAMNGSTDDLFTLLLSSAISNLDNKAIFLSSQLNQGQWQFIQNNNNTSFAYEKITNVQSYDGSEKSFNWTTMQNGTIEMRYYLGWKSVIRTDGQENEDTLSFPSLNATPYTFPSFSASGWSAFNSTLIYIKTSEEPLIIGQMLENGMPLSDIIGVWWENGWMGMGTRPIQYPIVIPPNQQAIIQCNHIVTGNVTFQSIDVTNLSSDQAKLAEPPTITFQEINPTKYEVEVENATQPFFLVFSESYDKGWVASIDGQQIPDQYHFTANGYANGWYINKTGTYTITLEFWPQKLFYVGSAISIVTLILCTLYVSKDKIKIIYRKYIKHKQVSKVN